MYKRQVSILLLIAVLAIGKNVNGYLRVKYVDSKNEYTVDQRGNIESEGEITQPENIAKSWERCV